MSHSNTSFPFYIHPKDKKRSVQIIKEAKAEIRKMESHRPVTPFSGRNAKNGVHNELNSRPSSCGSIKSLNYDIEENYNLPYRKLSPVRTSKIAEVCTPRTTERNINIKQRSKFEDQDLKLQPIISKPILLRRSSTNAVIKSLGDQTFTGFPPILRNETKLTAKECLENSESQENNPLIWEKELSSLNENCNLICEEFNKSIEILEPTSSQHIRSDNVSSTCNLTEAQCSGIEKDELDQLSKAISEILPTLERHIKFGKKKREEEVIPAIERIYNLLEDKNSFEVSFNNRIPLLKLLFKLLDTDFPVLSICIVKLLLEMKVKGKNLSNILRLVLKLMKDNEINFDKHCFVDLFLESMCEISIINNNEATLYGFKIIKTLICTNTLEMQYVEKCIELLFHNLKELNCMLSKEEKWDNSCNEVMITILSILRHLMEEESVWEILIQSNNLSEMLIGLNCFSQNSDVVETVMRLFGKIVDRKDGCTALSQCPEELTITFLSILEKHRYQIDTTLQITFVIGNLVSVDNKTALAFATSLDFINTIVVLGEYINEHIQFKDSVTNCFKSKNLVSCGDRNWQQDIFDVILKILCIWANICLFPEAGHYLAKHHSIVSHLLAAIAAYMDEEINFDASLPVHSFLVVIGNISYYFETDSDVCIKTAERVIPLLDECFPSEIRLEAANIVRNLTRLPSVRIYIQEHSLFPAFIKLLSEDNKDFGIGIYGIIMNLLIDEQARQLFYLKGGVSGILHKLHLCADRDWKTSALLCQILWNHCGGEKTNSISITKIEAQHLIKYLSYSINKNAASKSENEDTDFYKEWKNDFCPVAKNLLELLETKSAYKS